MPEDSMHAGVKFGNFTLYFDDRQELLQGTVPVLIRPKALQVLIHLVKNQPRRISSAELIEVFWNDDTAEENDVQKVIAAIRKALGSDGSIGARYIRTAMKRRGDDNSRVAYAFVADDIEYLSSRVPITHERQVSAFISYPEACEAEAARVRTYLDGLGITILELPYSAVGDIEACRAHLIRTCDHFLLLHSADTHCEPRVRRDLGLVLRLHSERQAQLPTMTILRSESLPREADLSFDSVLPIDPAGGSLPPYDLSKHHQLRLGPGYEQRLAALVRQMLTHITFLNGTDDDRSIFARSTEVYETLFSDPAERDSTSHIWHWIQNEQPQLDGSYRVPWRAIYGVYKIAEVVVGMTFVSGNVKSEFAFGNYFGVLRTWRHEDRANRFLSAIAAELKRVVPKARAIVFEVETVNFDYLDRVAHRRPLFGHKDDEQLLASLRNLKRLLFYSRKNAWVAVHAGNQRPAIFIQPALKKPYGNENERSLYLLVRPLEGSKPKDMSVPNLIKFAYDDLYASAYPFPKDGPEYSRALTYVQLVRDRVYRNLEGCTFSELRINDRFIDLLNRAEDEGYSEKLIL